MKRIKMWIGILFLLVICIIAMFVYRAMNYQNTSSERPEIEEQSETAMPNIQSSVDKDQDGIDDQTDILQGALHYVDTHPKYKSKYYNTGYPDDGYGVCTDVVTNALKEAGYDLMEQVQEDIAQHPAMYEMEEPDPNIDFRRVKNLQVYFQNTAIALTTDVSDIEQWQGGDIVVFQKHIGIVSDRRNEHGVPYVIHHNDPKQTKYEQDILEKRSDIVGHYRISE